MVRLRPLELHDAPAIYQAVDVSRDALRRWMPWYRDDYVLEDAAAWIQYALATAAAGRGFHFAIIGPDGALVGLISLEDVQQSSGRAMVGYWLATPATGRGLGRQALAAIIQLARGRLDITTLWAVVADANVPSRRILEVNGFHETDSRGRDERGDLALIYELDVRARSDG